MKQNLNIKEKRQYLKGISATLKELKEKGEIKTINEGLKNIYSGQGKTELRTFDQWKTAGYRVKRGEKALYLWGRETEKTITENGEEKEIFFFPIIPVFSKNQVYNPFNEK